MPVIPTGHPILNDLRTARLDWLKLRDAAIQRRMSRLNAVRPQPVMPMAGLGIAVPISPDQLVGYVPSDNPTQQLDLTYQAAPNSAQTTAIGTPMSVPQTAGQNATQLPPCSSITTPAGFVGPVQCYSDNGGQVTYTPPPNVCSDGSTPMQIGSWSICQSSLFTYGGIAVAAIFAFALLRKR